MEQKRLYRSTTSKVLGGVCGGVAEYFDVDPTLVRIAYLLLEFCTAFFPGILLYILCWLIVLVKK